jgi:spermidine/putrescine-binding protein
MPEAVLRGFEREYGVKVNYDTYSSNEEMHAKLKAGGTGYDIIVPSDYMVQVLRRENLLEPINFANIPNWSNIGDDYKDWYFDPGNRYTVPYMWGTTGIAYDASKIKREIKSWEDLWDPEFAGKVVLPDDAREVIGIALKTLGYSKNSTDPAELARAKAKLKRLAPNVKAYNSDSPKTLLLSGEVWIGAVWSGEAALARRENPNIAYVLPREGAGIWMDNLAIPRGAPHKYTAEVFINYLLRPEVSALLSEAYPYGNPNVASYDYTDPAYLRNPISYPPRKALFNAEWLMDIGEAMELYDRIWTEIKGG